MGMDLQTAIQIASNTAVQVAVVITMHDEEGEVLFGRSAPTFRTTGGGLFKFVSEGFSTVGNPMPGPNLQMNQFLASRLFPLGPEAGHRLAFAAEIGLHLGEPFNRGLDAMPESRTGQVPVDQLHLGLLAAVIFRLPAKSP